MNAPTPLEYAVTQRLANEMRDLLIAINNDQTLTGSQAEQATSLLNQIDEEQQKQADLEPYRSAAEAKSEDGALEVDANAEVSIGDEDVTGAYVSGWIWVDNHETT